ncbi:phenylalanine--tRNA ligase subunit beta [Patescibacteria group bacterium]|nr:phenylalanine--tRNA ligase subunit beta [Patescibacteria group bacterium]
MLFSKNWLKKYVFLPDALDPEEFASEMTLHTVEVEEVEDKAAALTNIVVGEVRSVEKHSNADSLVVAQVFDGEEEIPIVCGGSNVVEGMKVALGKIGAKVKWHGEGEPVELKKTKIRGEVSLGMICAAEEVGLSDMYPSKGEKEILDLSFLEVKAGTPLSKALEIDDLIIDVDNKSMTHRPDLWGHYGMAREIAAIQKKKLEKYDPAKIIEGNERKIKVHVEDKFLCTRYMGIALDGIEIAESPKWLKESLIAVGVRPINNIVDITNYVMFDLGQPMHAFDADKLAFEDDELTIEVRPAREGEKFTTLDDAEHELNDDNLLIADKTRALALAGVMGGKDSEIRENTSRIVFEAACFDATNVRRTAMKLGLRSESSARFEKTLDPNMAELAMRRAVELTLNICPNARVVSNLADEKNFLLNQGPIEISLEFLQNRIGMPIEKKFIEDALERLGFDVKEKKDVFTVTVPTWRATKDVSIREDLVEEVARMYGYDNIETQVPRFPIQAPEENVLRNLEHSVRDVLARREAFVEVYNYSYVSDALVEKLGFDTSKYIKLENPLQKDRPLLRRNLLINMLVNVEENLHRYGDVEIFEIGKTYLLEEAGDRSGDDDSLLPRQDNFLGIMKAAKGVDTPFFVVKGAIESIMKDLGLEMEVKKAQDLHNFVHAGRSGDIFVSGEIIGQMYELHPAVSKDFGIDERVAYAEINLDTLKDFVKIKDSYNKVSEYPVVERDMAFVLGKEVEDAAVRQVLRSLPSALYSIELFDVYDGEHMEEGKKSLAYKLVYKSDEKTLTTEEVEKDHQALVAAVKTEFGAVVRGEK